MEISPNKDERGFESMCLIFDTSRFTICCRDAKGQTVQAPSANRGFMAVNHRNKSCLHVLPCQHFSLTWQDDCLSLMLASIHTFLGVWLQELTVFVLKKEMLCSKLVSEKDL